MCDLGAQSVFSKQTWYLYYSTVGEPTIDNFTVQYTAQWLTSCVLAPEPADAIEIASGTGVARLQISHVPPPALWPGPLRLT